MDTKSNISNDRVIALWLTALVLLAAVAGGDYATGYEADFFAFYFLPVWLLGRHIGSGSGIAIAIFAAVAWFLVDQASDDPHAKAAISYWNGGVVLAACLAIAGAASSLRRKTIELERLKAELSEATAKIERLRVALPVHHFAVSDRSSNSLHLA
jgi:hypothetical protein